ncbi:medium chain dehydrogenase/reductase family protein [Streptosporangium sp. NPDC050280]|uniref:zinc-dependent alcohol dehydrogenase n=1 Tax=unclassified Streptosporangium TaxID=2632669 RepID=UPI003438DF68
MTISETSRRAVVVHRSDDGLTVSCDLLPVPPMEDAALRVRPEYIGICGSDLEQLSGGMDPSFEVRFPHVLGHEWSGVVVEAGPATSRFRPGDRVIGHGALGGNIWFGVSTDGAMADTFLVPEAMCFAVPPAVSSLRAALVEPLACCLQALRTAGGADAGHTVAVFGCGAIGLSMVGLARTLGARVVAVDRSPYRLDLAARLGADHRVEAAPGVDVAAAVLDVLGPRGADLVVEGSGAPAAQAAALDVTAQDARVLFMGLAHRRSEQVSLHRIQNRNLRLSSSTGAPPQIWEPTLRLLDRTGLDLSPMVSDVFAFEDCGAAVAAAADAGGHAKVMLSPDGGGHR